MSTATAEPATYLVTGASSGIGLATAQALAARGDSLVLVARSAEALERARRICQEAGGRSITVNADVRDRDSIERAFTVATAEFGPVDGVVHAAAVATYGSLEQVPPEVFDATVATTFLGTANVSRVALSYFHATGRGRLVVLGSILGSVVSPYMGAYTASKWAVQGLVRTLQIETRDDPFIDVVLVTPGGVDTPIYENSANYLGRPGKAPAPVQSAEKVAQRVLEGLDRPRRHVESGLANRFLRLAFRRSPALFDALSGPFMNRFGLQGTRVAPSTGNVFDSRSSAVTSGSGDPERKHMSGKQTRGAIVSRPVAAPASSVWQVLCDGWTYANWVVGASRVRDVDPEWPAPGSRIQHSFGPWPTQIQDYTRVEDSTPEREAILTARGWPLGEARVAIRITPTGPETSEVSIEEDAVAGPGRRVPLPLRQLGIIPRNKESLYRLALTAEGRYRNSKLRSDEPSRVQ